MIAEHLQINLSDRLIQETNFCNSKNYNKFKCRKIVMYVKLKDLKSELISISYPL